MRKITHKCKSVSRLISPIALALTLCACGTTSQNKSERLYDITVPAPKPSPFYLESAAGEKDSTKQVDLYLLALKALIEEARYDDATKVAIRLAKMTLTPLQLSEWQLNRATLLQKTGKINAAIDNLNFKPSWSLPSNQYQRYFLLTANLYQQLGNTPGMMMALALASPYISDEKEKNKNWDRLWTELDKLSISELDKLLLSNNRELIGWVNLNKLLRENTNDPENQQRNLENWLAKNPLHSANYYLPNALSSLRKMESFRPKTIAVLLPFSDKFASQGEAIRNGIVQGSLDDKSQEKPPSLKFYDTNSMTIPEIVSEFEQNSVDFVIGPLQKGKVEEYLNITNGIIPTLAMNIPQDQNHSTSSTCFFPLSPEQEAIQASQFIAKNNHHFPLVIAPDNEFGRRVSDAFAQDWSQQTGNKPEIALFKNQASMQKAVQNAFGLTQSQSRINQINQLLKLKIKSEQRSRRDIDAVYLIANADELTLLKPFIDVTINPDATPPKLYAGSRGNNRVRGIGELGELRNITFSDVPLIVDPTHPAALKYHKLWPQQSNNSARLYALGMDAYTLIKALPQMKMSANYRLDAQSGELSLSEDCVVNRALTWATFDKNGFIPVKQ